MAKNRNASNRPSEERTTPDRTDESVDTSRKASPAKQDSPRKPEHGRQENSEGGMRASPSEIAETARKGKGRQAQEPEGLDVEVNEQDQEL